MQKNQNLFYLSKLKHVKITSKFMWNNGLDKTKENQQQHFIPQFRRNYKPIFIEKTITFHHREKNHSCRFTSTSAVILLDSQDRVTKAFTPHLINYTRWQTSHPEISFPFAISKAFNVESLSRSV